jgi:hypothetical protein
MSDVHTPPTFDKSKFTVTIKSGNCFVTLSSLVGTAYLHACGYSTSKMVFLAKEAIRKKLPYLTSTDESVEGLIPNLSSATTNITVKLKIKPADAYCLGLDLKSFAFKEGITNAEIHERQKVLKSRILEMEALNYAVKNGTPGAAEAKTQLSEKCLQEGINLDLMPEELVVH